jgi:hypothetical protein
MHALEPSPTAVGMWSKDYFILTAIRQELDCPLGKNDETVYKKREIVGQWYIQSLLKRTNRAVKRHGQMIYSRSCS